MSLTQTPQGRDATQTASFDRILELTGTDGEPLFLVSAEDACIVVCVQCGISKHIVSSSTEERLGAAEKVARYVYSHLNETKTKGSLEHVSSRGPTRDGLRQQLDPVFKDKDARVKKKSIVFDQSYLQRFEKVMRYRTLGELEVCGECLLERKGNACCLSTSIKYVSAYTRGNCCPLLVADGLTGLRDLVRRREASKQSPSKRGKGSEIASSLFAEAEAIPFPPLEGSVLKRLRQEPRDHRLLFPESSGGNETFMVTNDAGQQLELRFDGVERSGRFHSHHAGSDLLGFGEYELRMWGSITGGTNVPSTKEARDLAAQFPPYDKTDGFQYLVHSGVESFLDLTQLDIESGLLSAYELTVIGKLPATASQEHIRDVASSREGDARVTSFAEFLAADSTKKAYISILARWLIGMQNLRLLGYTVLDEAIEKTRALNSQSQGDVNEWDLSILREAIGVLLLSIGTNCSDIAPVYLKSFFFDIRTSREQGSANGTVEGEEDDDGDEERDDALREALDSTDGEGEDSGELVICSLSTLKKRLAAFLFMLKRAAILRFCQLKENGTDRSKIGKLVEMFRGKPVLPSIAKSISNLNSLDASSGKDRYRTTLTGDEGPYLIIKISQYEFDPATVRTGYQRVYLTCRDSFLRLGGDQASAPWVKSWNAMCDPNSSLIEIGSSKRDNDAAILVMDPVLLGSVSEELRERLRIDRSGLRCDIEAFREAVLSAVYLFSGSVMRMPELGGLRLRSGVGKGNLFKDITWLGTPTLVFAGVISKTQKEGFALLCPFAARLVMFLLKVIGPMCHEFIRKDFFDCLGSLGEQAFLDTAELERVDRLLYQVALETYTSMIAVNTELSPPFLKAIRENPESAVRQISENSLRVMRDSDLRDKIGANVALGCFGLKSKSVLELRHLLVSHKTNILLYIRQIEGMTNNADMKQLISMLRDRITSFITQEASVHGLGSIGMHSALTNQSVYNVKVAIAGADVSVPNAKYISSQCAEAAISLASGIPMSLKLSPGNGGASLVHGPVLSILERLVGGPREHLDPEFISFLDGPKSEMDVDLFLLASLRKRLAQPDAEWISPEQARATRAVFTSTKDCVIALACGSGKTMTFALPFSLAPHGFGLVIVPYKSLLENYMICLQEAGIECLEMTSRNQQLFASDVFNSSSWTTGTKVRVVVSVADTAMKRESLAFMEAAILSGLLLGIVIDECHQLIMSSTYRDVQRRLAFLSCLRVPIILCSGTLPDGFRTSLMSSFSINRSLADVIVNPITLRDRLIVDLVRFDGSDLALFEGYLLEIVARHIELSGDSGGPILVFCMTKNMMQSLAKRAEDMSEFRGMSIVTLDSSCSKAEMMEYFKTFTGLKRVLAISTSFTAEGINYPKPIELVVVAAGTYGGGLMIHQMFSRAGRGRLRQTGESQPRGMFLYAPLIAVREGYGSVEAMQSESRALLIPIVPAAKRSVSSIIGFGSHRKLFGDKPGCGVVAMERLLNGDSDLEQTGCMSCFGCQAKNWIYPQPPAIDVSARENLERRMDAHVGNFLRGTRGQDYTLAKALIETSVRSFLTQTTGRCLACGGQAHYALQCGAFKVGDYNCRMCLSLAHNYQDVHSWLRRDYEGIKSAEVRSWGRWDTLSDKHDKLDCAIVVARRKRPDVCPCAQCWFEHVDGSVTCLVTGSGHSFSMRILMTYIWFHESVRESLLKSIEFVTAQDRERINAAEREGKGWRKFMHWAVYESVDDVQNLYRVVQFWIQNKTWT